MPSPTQPFIQFDDGALFPCEHGDIIGREGQVAGQRLASETMLSRRHLKIEIRAGHWIVLLLPDARNRTWFDQAEMRPGIACRLVAEHEIQVSRYRFKLRLQSRHRPPAVSDPALAAPGALPAPLTAPRPASTTGSSLATDPTADLTLDTLRSAPAGLLILDESFHCVWATEPMARHFGCAPEAIGCLLDQVRPSDRNTLRGHLENLRTSAEPQPVTLHRTATGGATAADADADSQTPPHRHPAPVTLRFTYQYPYYLGALAAAGNGTDSADDPESADPETAAAETAARLGRTLAGFTLARAFREGDLAKAMALLTVKCREALDCDRVTVWLATERDPAKLACQSSHSRHAAVPHDTIVNSKLCPDYFNRLHRPPYLASERENRPIFAILGEIGLIDPASRSVLATGIHSGKAFFGLIACERSQGNLKWSEPERHFALCAASFCLLSLQSRQREDALKQLSDTGQAVEADLAEARKYFTRILPQPLTDDHVDIEWQYLPCESLGGDCFGYHWIDADHFAAYVVDVVGHGSAAALLSVSVMNALRAGLIPVDDPRDPAAVISAINRNFQMEHQGMLTFTMWYGVFQRPARCLTYASAGHPPALLLLPDRLDGEPNYHELSTGGLIIGGMEDARYDNASVDLGPHEGKLFVFTDGAFEVPLGRDRMWTFEEFVAVVRSTQHMTGGETAYLLNRVRMLCDSSKLPDDFCMARILFKPDPVSP